MAWEWSHTVEAYEAAYKRLERKPLKWLIECLAECRAHIVTYDTDGTPFDPAFDNETYEREVAKLKHQDRQLAGMMNPTLEGRKRFLVGDIWQYAEQYATCDNGGWNLYMCPYGCHTIKA